MAAAVGENAAKRAAEPDFILPAAGARAKRAGHRPPAVPSGDLEPMVNKVYTNFSIAPQHRQALQRHARHRQDVGFTNKYDLSSVLRDWIDYCLDNEKEVGAWIARRYKAQGKR
jgi:hypothetical protein